MTTNTIETIDLDLIDVGESNPRSDFNETDLKRLSSNIESVGVLQPIIVARAGDRYTLIAGERRLRASRLAKRTTIPANVLEDVDEATRKRITVLENLQREQLNPIEEARGFASLRDDSKLSPAAIAKLLDKSKQTITDRLALLTLPEFVQQAIAAGTIPLTLLPTLRTIIEASEPVAQHVIGQLERGDITASRLANDVETALLAAAQDEADDAPFIIRSDDDYDLSILPPELVTDELRAGFDALDVPTAKPDAYGTTPFRRRFRFRLNRDDQDAAQAYGKTLSMVRHGRRERMYLCDAVWVADRFAQMLPAMTKDHRAYMKQLEAAKAPKVAPENADKAKAERRAERELAKLQQQQAIAYNRDLGHALRTKVAAVKLDVNTTKLLVAMILQSNPTLASAGHALVTDDLITVTETVAKNGNVRRTVDTVSATASQQAMEEWILRPNNPEEIVGRLVQAIAAAELVDKNVLPRAKRPYWHRAAEHTAEHHLDRLIGRHVPEAAKAKIAKRAERRAQYEQDQAEYAKAVAEREKAAAAAAAKATKAAEAKAKKKTAPTTARSKAKRATKRAANTDTKAA